MNQRSKVPYRSPGRWSLFKNSEFSRLWSIGALSNTIRWLELLAIGVFVFDLTNSPFQVAMMTFLRIVPFALFGAIAGTLTQRFKYRDIMMLGIGAMIGVTALLALLSGLQQIQLWHIAVGVFLSGIFWVLDFTIRRTSVGESVEHSSVGHAMGLDALTNNGTRALGPAIAGISLQWLGLTGVYVFGVIAYVSALILTVSLRPKTMSANLSGNRIFSSLRKIRPILKDHPPLTGLLSVTLVLNLWGLPFVSMIPVIGREVLHLESLYVGLLMSSEGCGALIGALLITSIRQQKYYRRLFVTGTILYLVTILVFSQSNSPLQAVTCLLVIGFGIAIFATMQSTLIILISPQNTRGLIMGLLSMCIGLGGPIGLLHMGFLADWLGPSNAIAILSCEGILALSLVLWKWPSLWHLENTLPSTKPEPNQSAHS